MIVAIEGNIASGKSTAIESLAAEGYAVFAEPVEKWRFITKFYEDKRTYSLPFSLEVLESFSAIPRTRADIVTERSPLASRNVFTRMLVNDNYMSEDEWEIYKKYYDAMGWSPDAIVYVDASPSVCLERMRTRGRSFELIGLDYLEKLERSYKTLLRFDAVPVVVVDGSGSEADTLAGVQRALRTLGFPAP